MSNPLFNMMNGNVQSILSNLTHSSPQQMLMGMLQKQNPQAYQQLQGLMNSGVDPNQILQQMTSQMTPQQMQQLTQLANKFGIK